MTSLRDIRNRASIKKETTLMAAFRKILMMLESSTAEGQAKRAVILLTRPFLMTKRPMRPGDLLP